MLGMLIAIFLELVTDVMPNVTPLEASHGACSGHADELSHSTVRDKGFSSLGVFAHLGIQLFDEGTTNASRYTNNSNIHRGWRHS